MVNFVADGAPCFSSFQQGSTSNRKAFSLNYLKTTRFRKLEQGLESGSGPGGRRLKFSRPDHLLSMRYGGERDRKLSHLGLYQVR